MRPAPELTIVVPTFNEQRQYSASGRAARRASDGVRLGGHFRRRQFAGRHRRGRARASARRQPRALHPPHRPARARRRLPRGHAGEPGALRRRDGRRPAARRDAARRRCWRRCARARRSRGREPLSRRRLGRRAFERSARASAAGSNALARRLLGVDAHRPDERLLHDPARRASRRIAPSLSSQGFKILLDILATARGSLRIAELPFDVPRAPARREQARHARSRSILRRWCWPSSPTTRFPRASCCSAWSA